MKSAMPKVAFTRLFSGNFGTVLEIERRFAFSVYFTPLEWTWQMIVAKI